LKNQAKWTDKSNHDKVTNNLYTAFFNKKLKKEEGKTRFHFPTPIEEEKPPTEG